MGRDSGGRREMAEPEGKFDWVRELVINQGQVITLPPVKKNNSDVREEVEVQRVTRVSARERARAASVVSTATPAPKPSKNNKLFTINTTLLTR